MRKLANITLLTLLALMLVACAAGIGNFEQPSAKSSQPAAGKGKTVVSYSNPNAKSVYIAGDFNSWNENATPMVNNNGTWSIELDLAPGDYGYKFVVDGNWTTDPKNNRSADDGYGGKNSVLTVGGLAKAVTSQATANGKTVVSYSNPGAKSVYIAGDFNSWNENATPMANNNGTWTVELDLAPGDYGYKFVVDGNWTTNPNNNRSADDGYGGKNSILTAGTSVGQAVAASTVASYGNSLTTPADGKFAVKFSYQPLIGGKVNAFVAGDFNSWSPTATPLTEDNGLYETTLYLAPGKYGYKFVVDGNWKTDDNATEFVDDGYGGQNAIVFAGDPKEVNALRKVPFSYNPGRPVKEVYLVGSMNDWNQKATPMQQQKNGTWKTTQLLKSGEYSYKFMVNGTDWITDNSATMFEDDGFGGRNSKIIVDNSYDAVTVEKGDGQILTWGLPTTQSLQTVNPLSPKVIEFKARTHKNDVEAVYLLKGADELPLTLVDSDNGYDYWHVLVNLDNPNKAISYQFRYDDGADSKWLAPAGFVSAKSMRAFAFNPSAIDPFYTPDWAKTGIIYQIFPDRFYNGDKSNDPDFTEWYYQGHNTPPPPGQKLKPGQTYYHLVKDWYDIAGLSSNPVHPEGKPDWWSFYGGDAVGVQQKLDYLADLGVTIIYFNPIFQAKSNHRYDAADYGKADPHFATEAEIKALVAAAHKRGIKVILDVAYNHTGETFWAFQDALKKGPNSQYYNWYEFKKWPVPSPPPANYKPLDYYECWWGYGEMPNLNYDLDKPNPSENSYKDIADATPNMEVVNYLNGLTDYWIGDVGFDGFRLDVPNEVPFWFWKIFRQHIKEIKPDAYLVGEIWSNAVEWVNNNYFDSVMNYAFFKDPVMRFFNQRSCNANKFDQDLKPGRLLYPTQATQVMMNLIDSHDTVRYLEAAGGDINRLKLAALFQMTYVGTPHIWYGDEIGMMGKHDPDCRRPMNWRYIEDPQKVALHDYYKKLIAIRKGNPVLALGDFTTLLADGMKYAYKRSNGQNNVYVVINNETTPQTITVQTGSSMRSISNLLTGEVMPLNEGTLTIKLPAQSGTVLR